MRVRLRGHHPLRPGIQPGSPHTRFSPTGGRRVGTGTAAPTTPMPQPPTGITRHRFSHHPLSLATTHGVSFPAGTEMFHFPAYPPHKTLRCRPTTAGGLPHSDTLGSKPCRRLPEAYRGPTRPSSVLPAKASTIRPWQQTHQPRKKGATGPCHLHWNTLRQLIRSSKHHPHQQCGRLTKTLANTIHAPTQQAGMERFDKINSTNTPGTPHRAHRSCSRPLSSSQTTTPHHPSTHPTQGHGQDGGNGTPPPTRGPGGPGTQQHAPHHRPPTPQGRRRLDPFPASKGHHPARRPGKEASHHRRTTVRPQNSVERR